MTADGEAAGAALLRSTFAEIVHNIAQVNEAAQWLSENGAHEDGAAATSAAGRLSEALAERMCSHGLQAIETATHRATLTSYEHGGEEHGSVLVVRRRSAEDSARSLAPSRALERDENVRRLRPATPGSATHPLIQPEDRPAEANQPRPGEEPPHDRLCPLGGGGTRWYVCGLHEPRVIFQAGSGRYDSIANSCPLCGRLGASYTGCACEAAARPVNRRRQRRRVRTAGVAPYLPEQEGSAPPAGSGNGEEGCP